MQDLYIREAEFIKKLHGCSPLTDGETESPKHIQAKIVKCPLILRAWKLTFPRDWLPSLPMDFIFQ